MENVTRHQWISEAAYYKAEAKNFTPGMELNDWLAAENDYVNWRKIMNKLLPLIGLLALFLNTSVFAPEVIDTTKKLDIYYFHGQSPLRHLPRRGERNPSLAQ